MMVVAVASGVVRIAALKSPVVVMRISDRDNCSLGDRLTASDAMRGPQARAATTDAKKKRPQVTCTRE